MVVIAKLDRLARDARSAVATRRAAAVLPYLTAARGAGATTLQHPADTLTAGGMGMPRDGVVGRPRQVRRVLDRAATASVDAVMTGRQDQAQSAGQS
jgi:hypothetical protein